MKYRVLITGFLCSIAVMVIIGLFALSTNQGILKSLDQGEHHFKAIATAATEVASYVKRAEGHLFLYLVLHREADKAKFPQRVASLNQQIAILDRDIRISQARVILEKIKANAWDILDVGNTLIDHHDRSMAASGSFDLQTHRLTLFDLHDKFSAVRRRGVELAALVIKMEDASKSEILARASRMRIYMSVLIVLASAATVYLGFLLNRMVKALQREIDRRRQVEEALVGERNKLREALAEVKVLSGLLPICSSCKKVRDDKGYWSQIEAYLRDRADLEFTHGICPDCLAKLYPDYDGEIVS